MKKVSTRQLIIFYFIYSFAIKFISVPQFLAVEVGRDAWIAAVVGVLVELLVLWIVLCVLARDKDTDVYQTLRMGGRGVGSAVFAKVVMAGLFAFVLLQSLITLRHTNFLLTNTLYQNLNIHLFLVPMIVLGIFVVYSKTRAVFRSGEIFYILVLIAIFLAVLPGLSKADMREVLPILSGGVSPVLRAVYNNLVYFEAGIILLLFKGEVDMGKAFKRKFMIWAAVGAVVFVALVLFCYSLFGPLSGLRTLGIVDITGYNSYIAQNGRLEWIIACVWLLLLALRFGILFYCCFASARYVTHAGFQPAAIVFPLAAIVYALVFFVTDLANVLTVLRPVILGFYVGLPLVFLFAALLYKKGGNKNV